MDFGGKETLLTVQREARENACERVTSFDFTSHWMKKFFSQSRNIVSAKPITFRHKIKLKQQEFLVLPLT